MCESQKRLVDNLVADLVTSKQALLIKTSVTKILKEQLGVVGIEPTEEEIDAAFHNEMLDVAWRLVVNGFKLTKDGFPIPANWDVTQHDNFSTEEWLEGVNSSLAERPSVIPKHWGYQSRDLVEFVRENFNKFKDSARAVHTDDLTTVLGFDDVGKVYGVFTNDDSKKRIPPQIINFHTGNPVDGINGISIESLLAICKNRLETFNKNGFDCTENNMAIGHIAAAITALEHRQVRRKEENKAGTQEK